MPEPFTIVRGKSVPLLIPNIDTDQIIPSREMRSTGKTGLAKGLFAGARYLPETDYEPDPDFVLNRREYAGVNIILAGENFGCGSSREHAVWALAEYGIKAIIAPSFAPIFKNNCTRNGLLCAILEADKITELAAIKGDLQIDLSTQEIRHNEAQSWTFKVDDEAKTMLSSGLEPIDLTLQDKPIIDQWLTADAKARPWIYLGQSLSTTDPKERSN